MASPRSTSWRSDSASFRGTRRPSPRRSIHSSFLNEHPGAAPGHNERLEFLGDAVDRPRRRPRRCTPLSRRRRGRPDRPTRRDRRARLASPAIARELGLDRYLLLGEGEAARRARPDRRSWPSTFEALVGAICLDSAGTPTRRLAQATLAARARRRSPRRDPLKCPKSRLQEHTQRTTGERPVYRVVEAVGPDHEKHFRIEVEVDGESLGRGRGPVAPDRGDVGGRAGARRAARGAGGVARGEGGGVGRSEDGSEGDAAAAGAEDRSRRRGGGRVPAGPLMTAPARLLGLRVQGFKSFAERTLVEFGPGISAVVGPNGSGKTNLADALRWALGEQGRSLRIRRSEDVIWAGSEKRSALGMADVTARARQRRRPAAGRVQRGRAGPAAVPLGRERLPAQPPAGPPARPRRPAGQREPRRERVPVHRPGHGRPGAGAAPGGAAAAVRGGRRRPPARAAAAQGRGAARRGRGEPVARRGHPRRASAAGAPAGPARRAAGARGSPRARSWPRPSSSRRMPAGTRQRPVPPMPSVAATRFEPRAASPLEALERAETEVAEIAASMAARSELEAERRAAHEAARTEHTALGLREARAIGELEATARDRTRIVRERAAAEADLEAHAARARAARPRAGSRAGGGARRRRPCARRRPRGAGRAPGGESRAGRRAGGGASRGGRTGRRGRDRTPPGRRHGAPNRRGGAAGVGVCGPGRRAGQATLAQATGALIAAQADERASIAAREAAGLAADAADGNSARRGRPGGHDRQRAGRGDRAPRGHPASAGRRRGARHRPGGASRRRTASGRRPGRGSRAQAGGRGGARRARASLRGGTGGRRWPAR